MKLRIIKTIFVSLVFSLLACTIPAHSIDNNPSDIVEMYSDEKPKLFLYSEGSFEGNQQIIFPSRYEPVHDLGCYGNTFQDVYALYISKGDDGNAVIIRCIQGDKFCDPDKVMNKKEFSVYSSFFKKNKWDVPRHVSENKNHRIEAYHLSWRQVDAFFHGKPTLAYYHTDFPENDKLDRLYKQIADHGLQSQIQRWMVVQTKESYKVFFVYDEPLGDVPELEISLF